VLIVPRLQNVFYIWERVSVLQSRDKLPGKNLIPTTVELLVYGPRAIAPWARLGDANPKCTIIPDAATEPNAICNVDVKPLQVSVTLAAHVQGCAIANRFAASLDGTDKLSQQRGIKHERC